MLILALSIAAAVRSVSFAVFLIKNKEYFSAAGILFLSAFQLVFCIAV